MTTSVTTAPIPCAPAVSASRKLLPVYLKLALVAIFWSGTFVAGRVLAHALPHLVAAAARFTVAVALLLVVAWRVEGGLPRLTRSQVLATAALGLTGIFLYNMCFFGALGRIPAGRAALFIALNPVVTAIAAAAIFGERLGRVKWIGAALAFLGVAIVITRGDPAGALHDISQSFGLGELLMFCAISSWAAYTLIGRHALKGLTPIAATTYAAIWGWLFLVVASSPDLPHVEWARLGWHIWAAIGYLGAFGTVIGFVWYYEGVKAIGPSRAAMFNNLVPVSGMALAALFLGEPILASMVVGGLLAISGVMLANRN
jgi:drug/metabolite transporter (DMT)-like permease